METISQGRAAFRTKLMTEARAHSFAKALTANRRFAFVLICHSARAKGPECFFVQFQPSSEARKLAIIDRQQSVRAQRAASGDFTSCKDPHTNRWWVFSPVSGCTYETTATSCDCPDARQRANPAGLACKHSIHVRGEMAREAEVREQRAELARRFDEIFQ
jgi:hypothetical protein